MMFLLSQQHEFEVERVYNKNKCQKGILQLQKRYNSSISHVLRCLLEMESKMAAIRHLGYEVQCVSPQKFRGTVLQYICAEGDLCTMK